MVKKASTKFDKTVLLFHGGGALGSYQAGVYKGLSGAGYYADWIIGTSIGAITGAIIAGNHPKDQVKKLYDFWEHIATLIPSAPDTLNNIFLERTQHFMSAAFTELNGQRNFFRPRAINPWLSIQSTADKLSYYDTNVLRETLNKFINFDLINEKKVRLSMGAVHITTGELVYFDNTKIKITVDHVMASCALPPGFPAVRIDDQFFWDGGVHSNTQLNLLLHESRHEHIRYLCFMVHLFDSYGMKPTNMDDVMKRRKDIYYSSHHRQSINIYRELHNLRHAISIISHSLSKAKKKDPELKKLIDLGRTGIIHVARFHCRGRQSDMASKDYEFSLPSILDHMKEGYDDVHDVLINPPWERKCPKEIGLVLYEISDHPVKDDNPFEEPANYHYTL